jgi:hypothetical protein
MLRMAEKKPGRRRDPNSKRSRGENRHVQPRKAFHADQALFDALERYIGSTRPQPSEAECFRVALEEFLEKRGFWPAKEPGP